MQNPTMWILRDQAATVIKSFLEKHADLFRERAAGYDATTYMADQILAELKGGENACQDAQKSSTRG